MRLATTSWTAGFEKQRMGHKRGAEQEWSSLSEPDLIRLAQSGETKAFECLVRRHQRPLQRYLTRLVKQPQLGQDLAQESFLRTWRHLQRLEPEKNLGPWLFRVGTNLALNHLERRSWRFRSLFKRRSDGEEVEQELISPEQNAQERLLRQEGVEHLQKQLEKLKPEDRAVLLLYYGEEVSCREIGEVLGVAESAAKVRLFRARERLKRHLLET